MILRRAPPNTSVDVLRTGKSDVSQHRLAERPVLSVISKRAQDSQRPADHWRIPAHPGISVPGQRLRRPELSDGTDWFVRISTRDPWISPCVASVTRGSMSEIDYSIYRCTKGTTSISTFQMEGLEQRYVIARLVSGIVYKEGCKAHGGTEHQHLYLSTLQHFNNK